MRLKAADSCELVGLWQAQLYPQPRPPPRPPPGSMPGGGRTAVVGSGREAKIVSARQVGDARWSRRSRASDAETRRVLRWNGGCVQCRWFPGAGDERR